MAPREQLHEILTNITSHVYFQPKENDQLEFPCIIYRRDYRKTEFANNKPYNSDKRYAVTVVDRDPDSDISEQVAVLPMSTFDRFYTADGLNHDVYQVFF